MTKDPLHIHRALKYASDMKRLDTEERLLVLMTTPGKELYCVGTRCLIDDVPDEECELLDCDTCKYDREYVVFPRKATYKFLCELATRTAGQYIENQTVFTTKEEAQNKCNILNKQNKKE